MVSEAASDFDILKEMIKDTAKLTLLDIIYQGKKKNKQRKIELTEPQHPNSKVVISGLPEDCIVIKADSFKSPDTIFNGSRSECKRADFIIIADSINKKVILFIEMKVTRKQENEIVAQLTGALCLIGYIQEIGKEFWKQENFLEGYSYRFISICHTSISKEKTRAIPRKDYPKRKHDRPDEMLKIIHPGTLRFEELAG